MTVAVTTTSDEAADSRVMEEIKRRLGTTEVTVAEMYRQLGAAGIREVLDKSRPLRATSIDPTVDIIEESRTHLDDLLHFRIEAAKTTQVQLARVGARSYLVPDYALDRSVQNGERFLLVVEWLGSDESGSCRQYRSAPLGRFPGARPGHLVQQQLEESDEVISWEIVGEFLWIAGGIADPDRGGEQVSLVAEAPESSHPQEVPC